MTRQIETERVPGTEFYSACVFHGNGLKPFSFRCSAFLVGSLDDSPLHLTSIPNRFPSLMFSLLSLINSAPFSRSPLLDFTCILV